MGEQPASHELRILTLLGALLVAAGAIAGWFTRTQAELVDGPVRVVRPDDVLHLGIGGWLVLVPLVLAPLAPVGRRSLALALAFSLPGLVYIVTATVVRARTAVNGETIGEVVVARTLGQGLSLAGALIVVMTLATAWRRAPDWRAPARWARGAVPER